MVKPSWREMLQSVCLRGKEPQTNICIPSEQFLGRSCRSRSVQLASVSCYPRCYRFPKHVRIVSAASPINTSSRSARSSKRRGGSDKEKAQQDSGNQDCQALQGDSAQPMRSVFCAAQPLSRDRPQRQSRFSSRLRRDKRKSLYRERVVFICNVRSRSTADAISGLLQWQQSSPAVMRSPPRTLAGSAGFQGCARRSEAHNCSRREHCRQRAE